MINLFLFYVFLALAPKDFSLGASPAPLPSLAAAPLTAGDIKSLGREFSKAQGTELEAIKHRQSIELKELLASQAALYKEWNKKEQTERHKYFEAHKGAERRTYIKDFILRREAFLKLQKDDKVRRLSDQEVHLKSLKEDQAVKLREFREYLNRGVRPPERFWPDGR